MTENTYDYDQYVQSALLGVVRNVLTRVSKEGLLGEHYFYISFRTKYPDVLIPEYLKEKHPEEITIVFQYQFWDLKVYDSYFTVFLSFNGTQELLKVPFASITSFVDPYVKFGLQFRPASNTGENIEDANNSDEKLKENNVIVLDKFRKK